MNKIPWHVGNTIVYVELDSNNAARIIEGVIDGIEGDKVTVRTGPAYFKRVSEEHVFSTELEALRWLNNHLNNVVYEAVKQFQKSVGRANDMLGWVGPALKKMEE